MARLNKQNYTTNRGEKKINCYHVTISKELLSKTNIKDTDEIVVYAKDNKIIIEKTLI